ncbi:MAG: ABC transporter ATP-binding protein [Gammaproteobacteria bacterium]
MTVFLETLHMSIQLADKIICRDLNLQIRPGDVWGILGANGSGKTTLLHTLANLRSPVSGEILLLQKNVNSLNAKKMARELGILLQDTQLVFPQTVFEYCLAGRYPHLSMFAWENAADRELAMDALRMMEMENLVQQNVFTLSGGERRRLAIATLLTQGPKVYLLDEPTNHLDLRHQVNMMRHFQRLAGEGSVGIVMSLHDVNLAQQYCNKILMLGGDGCVLMGPVEEMLNVENLSWVYGHLFRRVVDESVWMPSF